MKRASFVALLLCCCIVLLSIPVSAAAVPSGYTAISTADQLMGITNMSGKYILTADIDLTGKTWVPLGSADAPLPAYLTETAMSFPTSPAGTACSTPAVAPSKM